MTTRRLQRLVLTGSITGAVIVALDGTVLTVAQPALQRDLRASFGQVQWTSTGYLIAVASLLVFAGRLGDRYGHQQVFALGILGFGATSAGIGLAPGVGWVIGLRVVQGIFGALLQPATLGMLRAAYPSDRLGMPLALRTSAIGLAAAAGPVLGGALVAHWGWRSVFFLNVVPACLIGALALAVRVPVPAPAPVPEAREASAGANGAAADPRPAARLDLPGACLLALTLVCLVHTLIALPETGWTVATSLAGAAAVFACGAFIRHERRTASPLIPLSVVGSTTIVAALAVLLAASAALFGALFVSTYFLQDVLAMDPLECGLRVLPLAVLMVLSAPASAVLQRRYGPRRTTVVAMTLLTLGILALSQLDRTSTAPAIGGGFLLLGAGFGTVMVTATAVIVRHVSTDHAGVAGGLQQTAMNIGPTLGVATATMLVTLTTPTTTGARPPAGPHWTGEAFLSAMGPTLLTLAAIATTGALAAFQLPRNTATDDAEDDSPHSPATGGRNRALAEAPAMTPGD
ncbi:MFS transporter [Streptomyces tubercidicus]|uniref:MFS transporter n=1 Tax=Streptomyces tubercidicus TaxID=47759 RepID=A0A640ULY9_9ACTN|nr:MFS transporter [Streptomyces tubercidicus]WAU11306.1 MFS transporter [Streptomyces tubercidicus]GFE36550.1 MFS transporter [Streptomyces tubercidicus]